MRKKSVLLQLYLSYLLIMLLAVSSVSWYASRTFRTFYLDKTKAELTGRARLVEKNLPPLSDMDHSAADALCKEWGKTSADRITIILASGKVVGDSEENPAQMDNHRDRPEVSEALSGREAVSRRYSYTLQKKMMYVAVPLMREEQVAGVVRTAVPLLDINKTLFHLSSDLIFGGIVVAGFAAVFGFIVSRRITQPLAELKEGAERFAKGELGHKLAVSDTHEIGGLAQSMNRMAVELHQRINEAIQQRNEQEAVLSSMKDGVIAVDSNERLININQAASRLIGADCAQARGRSIQEVVRNSDLQRFVRRALKTDESVETDIVLYDGDEKHVQARGTPLRDARGRCIGAVLVLSDVSALRRLENVRRDFVANVSHELKTPITSIKGFVETLLDEAFHEPDDAQRFLSIIAKQADRLEMLIEDLLTLAKIEQEAERESVALSPATLLEVIESAIHECAQKSAEKQIAIVANCPGELQARINTPLLEQALINLLDNAIKYSEPGKSVAVEAYPADSEMIIAIQDEGCGIEKEHLPRLFERFYRVDKARSRKLGGTGLGLAIVKHIVQAHGGRVSVESNPGKGSVFRIHLPNVKLSLSQ